MELLEDQEKIISRENAKELGMTHFYTGVVCFNGHIAKRLVSNGQCVVCKYEYGKRIQKNNPEKCRKYCRQYRLRNPEYFKIKDANKLKRESPQARKNRLERQKKYHRENKEVMNAKNREYRKKERLLNPDAERERSRRYRKNHPDRIAALYNFRRAIKKGADADKFLFNDIFERDNWRCQICGKKLNNKRKMPHPLTATVDHIIPLSLGGSHKKDNVQCACLGCNQSKGNRPVVGGEQLLMFGI